MNQPPTKGIESSAERLGAALDSLHAGTLVYMESGARQIGEKFHLKPATCSISSGQNSA